MRDTNFLLYCIIIAIVTSAVVVSEKLDTLIDLCTFPDETQQEEIVEPEEPELIDLEPMNYELIV